MRRGGWGGRRMIDRFAERRGYANRWHMQYCVLKLLGYGVLATLMQTVRLGLVVGLGLE